MCRQLKAKCDELKPCKSCKEKKVECKYREAIPKQWVSLIPFCPYSSAPSCCSCEDRALTCGVLGKTRSPRTSWILFWHCRNPLTCA